MGDWKLARVPERYGTFWAADGKKYRGGELAPMSARMLAAYGVQPESVAPPAPAKQESPVKGGK